VTRYVSGEQSLLPIWHDITKDEVMAESPSLADKIARSRCCRGWTRQQQARFLKQETIERRVSLVRRVAVFTGQYPWQWLPGEGEAFITQGCSGERGRPIAMSTARGYETDLRLFMEYLTDPRYGWPASCQQRFGTAPQQLFHESNSVVHVSDYECPADPAVRPLVLRWALAARE
jgi:hypothetical protein